MNILTHFLASSTLVNFAPKQITLLLLCSLVNLAASSFVTNAALTPFTLLQAIDIPIALPQIAIP